MTRKTMALLAALVALCAAVGFWGGVQYASRHLILASAMRESLFFYPLENDITEEESEAARHLYRYLHTRKRQDLEGALSCYRKFLPGPYTGGVAESLFWLCRYFEAPDKDKRSIEEDKPCRRFLRVFGRDGFAPLKAFITTRYPGNGAHAKIIDRGKMLFLNELMKFNSPARKEWEQSAKIVESLGLRPGQAVADIGSGPGYYTFLFSDIVGEKGIVYASEINEDHLAYIEEVAGEERIGNIRPVRALPEDPGLEENSIDCAFLCTTYQAVYGSMREQARRLTVEGIRRALRPGGLLVIVDNEPNVKAGEPCQGIAVSKVLFIPQLQSYGFTLVRSGNPVPQRYMLFFRRR